jgi:hypothetical protein
MKPIGSERGAATGDSSPSLLKHRPPAALVDFCAAGTRKNSDYPARYESSVRRSLRDKKSPDRRFLGVLRAKRDKLLENKKSSEITPRLNSYKESLH